MSNLMIIRPVGAELFQVSDGQTDMIKLIAAFRSFEKAPKNKNENKRRCTQSMQQALPKAIHRHQIPVVKDTSGPTSTFNNHTSHVSRDLYPKKKTKSVNERDMLRLCLCVYLFVCLFIQFLKHPTGFQDVR
jgi:hypothetical protein